MDSQLRFFFLESGFPNGSLCACLCIIYPLPMINVFLSNIYNFVYNYLQSHIDWWGDSMFYATLFVEYIYYVVCYQTSQSINQSIYQDGWPWIMILAFTAVVILVVILGSRSYLLPYTLFISLYISLYIALLLWEVSCRNVCSLWMRIASFLLHLLVLLPLVFITECNQSAWNAIFFVWLSHVNRDFYFLILVSIDSYYP